MRLPVAAYPFRSHPQSAIGPRAEGSDPTSPTHARAHAAARHRFGIESFARQRLSATGALSRHRHRQAEKGDRLLPRTWRTKDGEGRRVAKPRQSSALIPARVAKASSLSPAGAGGARLAHGRCRVRVTGPRRAFATRWQRSKRDGEWRPGLERRGRGPYWPSFNSKTEICASAREGEGTRWSG